MNSQLECRSMVLFLLSDIRPCKQVRQLFNSSRYGRPTFSDTSIFKINISQSPSGSSLQFILGNSKHGMFFFRWSDTLPEADLHQDLETSSAVVEILPPYHIIIRIFFLCFTGFMSGWHGQQVLRSYSDSVLFKAGQLRSLFIKAILNNTISVIPDQLGNPRKLLKFTQQFQWCFIH